MSQHETARILFELATAPFILMGGFHALASLIDTLRLTFFAPTKPGLRSEMEVAGIRLREMFPGASGARFSTWRGWLGFNISHGLGAATFRFHDANPGAPRLRPRAADQRHRAAHHRGLRGLFLLAVRFWFYAPAIGCGLGLACFIAAAALS